MCRTPLTPARDTCDALEAAGFPQDTMLGWTSPEDRVYGSQVMLRQRMEDGESHAGCGAPTLSEVLAHLPAHLDFSLPHPIFGVMERKHTLEVRFGERVAIGYHVLGSHEVQLRIEHESAVEAAARLYLVLHAAGRIRSKVRGTGEGLGHLAWAA